MVTWTTPAVINARHDVVKSDNCGEKLTTEKLSEKSGEKSGVKSDTWQPYPCSAMLHAKKVDTTTGPSMAWLRNTLMANGEKLVIRLAPAV